jgi:hypothetical protein
MARLLADEEGREYPQGLKDGRHGWRVNTASRRFRATIMTDMQLATWIITTTSIIMLAHPDSTRIKE